MTHIESMDLLPLPKGLSEQQFKVFLTKDGSPTLEDSGIQQSQTMHHRGGAFSETAEIYGKPIRATLEKGKFHFLVMGLGLGYIELEIAKQALELGVPPEKMRIRSFESVEPLQKAFLNNLNSPVDSVYQRVFSFYPSASLRILQELREKNFWQLDGKMDASRLAEIQFDFPFNCLLFDAYSSKASPELWSPEFLYDFLMKARDPELCYFSTYACTSVLKSALLRAGFVFQKRKGFLGKRDSTFAFLEKA